MKTILITGGAGYVGTVLTPQLLDAGYNVAVYDTMYYGCYLRPRPRLRIIEADLRDTGRLRDALWGVDAVIHLACISNDPSFELDEELSRTINYDCFEPLVVAAREQGVRRFIYASTSSVYGVSEAPEVKEDHPLVPLTLALGRDRKDLQHVIIAINLIFGVLMMLAFVTWNRIAI